jgi:adenylate kinase
MKIIFLGSPGVGKGTIADMLKDKYNLKKISTGDLLRENISNNTDLGIKAKEYIDKGELVPDEIVIGILEKAIQDLDSFILDGFPRTINQAKALEKITSIDRAVNFFAKDETIIDRLSGRRICLKCNAIYHIRNIPPKQDNVCDVCNTELTQREDDKEEAIKNRLEQYKQQTKPLEDFYKDKNLLVEVDTDKPLEEIFKDTKSVLGLN